MTNLRFSTRTLMLAFAALVLCFAILHNRVQRQRAAVVAILNSGGEAFFSLGDPKRKTASVQATKKDYLFHWYKTIQHVVIYPDNENPTKLLLEIAATIPNLTSVNIYPDCDRGSSTFNMRSENSITNDDIKSVAKLLPNLRHLCIAPVKCSPGKGDWLESQIPQLSSGMIMWHPDIHPLGRSHDFTD